jgi:septal ring factor EnvC (AmiA/AmiB activator)
MAFQYRYKAFTISNKLMGVLKRNSRATTIVSILIILTFSFYLITTGVTGYITYTENLEAKLNETEKDLEITKSSMEACSNSLADTRGSLSSCNSDLSQSTAQLSTCEIQRNDLTAENSQLESDLSTCDAERADYINMYETRMEAFNNLVRNSVKAICCSFSDIDSGTTKDWGIEDNKIVCTGGYQVNCDTGETNY